MKVKKFRQPTVKEALRAVREDLGPQALVLSTETVPAGGWRGWVGMREVQVTAGMEATLPPGRTTAHHGRQTDTRLREDATARQARSREDATARQARSREDATPRRARSREDAAAWQALSREEAPAWQLREDEDAPARKSSGGPDHLIARLLASGLDRTMAEAVAKSVPFSSLRATSLKELQTVLAAQLEDLARPDSLYSRAEVFIGPPGVGKTTTIAKIAAQERARKGRPLGLVGADGFRAGAVEQLRTYASIIGAPFRIARTIEELEQAMTTSRHSLLVDTAGRSPHDGGLRELRRLLGNRRGIRTHLVMAGDTSATSARRILDAYYDARPDRVVISKVDEAESLSPLLSVLRERQLAVSYVTTGQRVPEDLQPATPLALASVVLRDAAAY